MSEGAEPVAVRRVARRRRRENVAGGRQYQHLVRVTPEEEAQLLRLAAAHRVSVPRLLMDSALRGDGAGVGERRQALDLLFSANRLLGAVSNNLNQVARATNATRESQPELLSLLPVIRRVAMRVESAVDRLA